MAKLTLYDFECPPIGERWETASPFVMKVSRALRMWGLPHTIEQVPFQKIKQYNPLGQLPALAIDGRVVCGSSNILKELIRVGDVQQPDDRQTRAESWLWSEFGDTSLYPLCLGTRWQDENNWPNIKGLFFSGVPAPFRFIAGKVRKSVLKRLEDSDFARGGNDILRERTRNTLAMLNDRAPKAGFWLGSKATVADISLFAHLHCLRSPLSPEQAKWVQNCEALSAYLDRVEAQTKHAEQG